MLRFLSRLTGRVNSLDKFVALSQVSGFDLSPIVCSLPEGAPKQCAMPELYCDNHHLLVAGILADKEVAHVFSVSYVHRLHVVILGLIFNKQRPRARNH